LITFETALLCKGQLNSFQFSKPVPDPIGRPEDISQIHDLELIIVKTDEQMRIWNECQMQESGIAHSCLNYETITIGRAHSKKGGKFSYPRKHRKVFKLLVLVDQNPGC